MDKTRKKEFGIEQISEMPGEAVEEGFAEARRRLTEAATVRREARAKDAEMNQLMAKGDMEAAGRERLKMLNSRWPDPITPEALLGGPVRKQELVTTRAPALYIFQITGKEDKPPYYMSVKYRDPNTPQGVTCDAYATTAGFKVWAASGVTACSSVDAYAGVGNAWRVSTPCSMFYDARFDLTTNWSTFCHFASAHSEGWIGLIVYAYDSNWRFQGIPVWVQQWLWDDDSYWSGAGGGHYLTTSKLIGCGSFQGVQGWYYCFCAWGGIEISAEGSGWTWSKSSAVIEAVIPSMRLTKMTF